MLTPFEKTILDLMLDQGGEPFKTIRQQLAHAKVSSRQFGDAGFFTNFYVSADAPVRRDLPDMQITDVGAEASSLKHGAGFVLFIRDGAVSLLEGFTYDEPWPEKTDDFKLIRRQTP